jgi:hypothetical protein
VDVRCSTYSCGCHEANNRWYTECLLNVCRDVRACLPLRVVPGPCLAGARRTELFQSDAGQPCICCLRYHLGIQMTAVNGAVVAIITRPPLILEPENTRPEGYASGAFMRPVVRPPFLFFRWHHSSSGHFHTLWWMRLVPAK